MTTTRLSTFQIAVLLIASQPSPFSAEPVPPRNLFVTKVALKPIAKTDQPPLETKTEIRSDKTESQGTSATFASSTFSLDSTNPKEVPVESRAQQIEAMNGTPLLRPGASLAPASSPIKRAFDLLLPPGKPLLSKNPNARRNSLLLLEE